MPTVCREEGLEGIDSTDTKIRIRIFKTLEEAEKYLLGKGYHQTGFYATWGYSSGNRDFTRDMRDGNRFHAWIQKSGDVFVIGSEGPEPNPEFTLEGVVNGMWPVRAFKWHRRC